VGFVLTNKLRFSKKVVISAITAVIGYTLIVLGFSWFDKIVPVELTVGWFTFWGVEVVALMRISIEDKKCQEGSDE
jgi:F0F1-type ATP synthase assembly protein I